MSDILNKDIQAVKLLVEQIVSAIKNHEHNYDRTFLSVVKGITVKGTVNYYTVQDESGVDRKVKCAIPNVQLTVGQSVWVIIPCGTIEKMHICGVN